MSVHKQQGFTVIELITIILIVGVLAAVAVPGFRNLRINSQISGLSGDMAASLNRARSLAISTRSSVFLVMGPGTSNSDLTAAQSWAAGWRVVQGDPSVSTSVIAAKVARAGATTDVSVLVTNGAVSATGATTGAGVNTIGFNNFGQLIAADGSGLAQAAVVICSTDAKVKESGRAIAISRIGRVSNNVVTDPPCQA